MYEYIKTKRSDYIPGICEEKSWWDVFYENSGLKYIMMIVDLMHERIFMIAIIIILIATGIDYTKDGAFTNGTDPLKDSLLGINFGIAGILSIFVVRTLIANINKNSVSSTPSSV